MKNKVDQLLTAIGKNIKEIRMSKGIPQQDLASLCNFEKSSMCRIEMGKNNITIKTLYAINKALNVSINDLINDIDQKL